MMNRSGWCLGGLLAVLGLCVACDPKMRSLGDEGTAGNGGDDGGSTAKGGSSAKGGATAKGGSSAKGGSTAKGGATSEGGATFWSTTTSMGGATGPANTSPIIADDAAYPLNPTLPVDATCACASPDEICNAAKLCVPRCDEAGHCAVWLTNRGVQDLFVDGSTVFYSTAPSTDTLGNREANGSLYRVTYPNGTPSLIATNLGSSLRILGRYNGSTYILSNTSALYSIHQVTDAGVVTKLDDSSDSADLRGGKLVYVSRNLYKLMLRDLDASSNASVLVDNTSQPIAIGPAFLLDDYAWYTQLAFGEDCSLKLSGTGQVPTCPSGAINYDAYETSADLVFVRQSGEGGLTSISPVTGQVVKKLFDGFMHNEVVYASGWIYLLTSTAEAYSLVRVPATVGRQPQVVLPTDIARPIGGSPSRDRMQVAVGAPGIFWTQGQADTAMNQGQYIFHSALPAQPCDAELPCAEATQTCTNGFCTK